MNILQQPLYSFIMTAFLASPALGQFALDWWTTAGGGGTSVSASFELAATVGQTQANSVALSGGGFTLVGGFWVPPPAPALHPGDLNCDGIVDFDDINPFIIALADPVAYQQAYPDCNFLNGDCNGDGYVDFDDINPFIVLLSSKTHSTPLGNTP